MGQELSRQVLPVNYSGSLINKSLPKFYDSLTSWFPIVCKSKTCCDAINLDTKVHFRTEQIGNKYFFLYIVKVPLLSKTILRTNEGMDHPHGPLCCGLNSYLFFCLFLWLFITNHLMLNDDAVCDGIAYFVKTFHSLFKDSQFKRETVAHLGSSHKK